MALARLRIADLRGCSVVTITGQAVLLHVVGAISTGDYDRQEEQLVLNCPSCGKDRKLYVNVDRKLYHCFRCKIGGSLRDSAARDAGGWATVRAAVPTYRSSSRSVVFPLDFVPLVGTDGRAQLGGQGKATGSLVRKAYDYLLRRGVTHEQIWRYAASVVAFEARVFFPYWEVNGRVTFSMGRALTDAVQPKTIEPHGSDKPLFGRHINRLRDQAVLVEGAFDHLATPSSYGLMGSGVTEQQAATLIDDGVRKVFQLFDPDADEQSARSASKLARRGLLVHRVRMETEQDPSSLGREVMTGLVEELLADTSLMPRVFRFRP